MSQMSAGHPGGHESCRGCCQGELGFAFVIVVVVVGGGVVVRHGGGNGNGGSGAGFFHAARILGEGPAIHSPPAPFFFLKWGSARAH